MTRVALLTEIAAPYRIPLFNALAAEPGIDLEVVLLAGGDPRRTYDFLDQEFRFTWRLLPGHSLLRGDRWTVISRLTFRELRRSRPDVVIVGGWNQPAFWQALAYAKVRRRPLVAWVESTARDERGASWLGERAKRRFARACSGFVVPGSASAEYVRGLGGDRPIAVAPNAVDARPFAAASADRGQARADLGLERCTFLSVGRLSREKGHDVLVRAAAGVPADVVLVGGGPEEERLRALASENVRFAGRVEPDELPRLYAAADAFFLPSRSETWGMVLNEAAAAGLPLVATEAAGGAYDLIEHGVNGFRVPVGDEEALARAMRRLAEDEDFRRRAGERSLELSSRFTPEAWAAAVADLVRRLAASSPGSTART